MTKAAALPTTGLLVVTGKGGVGKTTVASALAWHLASRGGRTLLLEIDPRENAHRLLGLPPTGGELSTVLEGRLWLQNVRPRAVLDDLVRGQVPVRILARRVLASPVYEHFAAGCPGLEELAVLGHALRCLEGKARGLDAPLDVVVLDAPATGHGLSLLAAPRLVSEVIEQGPIGRLAGRLAEVLADPDRGGLVAVATAEEMPVQELLELLQEADSRLLRGAEAVVVNQLYPALPAGSPPEDPLGRLWRRRRQINDAQLERLRGQWAGPLFELPLLPVKNGPELVRTLAGRLAGWA